MSHLSSSGSGIELENLWSDFFSSQNDLVKEKGNLLRSSDHREVIFHNQTDQWVKLRGTFTRKSHHHNQDQPPFDEDADATGLRTCSSRIIAPNSSYSWYFLGDSPEFHLYDPFLCETLGAFLPDHYETSYANYYQWTCHFILPPHANNKRGTLLQGRDTLWLQQMRKLEAMEKEDIVISRKVPANLFDLCESALLRAIIFESHSLNNKSPRKKRTKNQTEELVMQLESEIPLVLHEKLNRSCCQLLS